MGNTTIDINGKRYDARSGALLGESAKPAATHKRATRQGRVVDGFTHGPHDTSVHRATHIQITAQAAAKNAELAARKAKRMASAKQADKAITLHKPQQAKTLMRHIVTKPHATPKKSLKAQAPNEMQAVAVRHSATSLKLAAHNVDRRRMTRAHSTRQSQHIKRFTTAQQNHPAPRQHSPAAPAQLLPPQQIPAALRQPTHRRPVQPQAAVSRNHVQAKPQPSDIFEAAIANARSHEQPAHKPRRKARGRAMQAAAFVAAFVIIGGFVAYMNMPNIELRIASVKAGFHAQLPDYKPTGYAKTGGIQANNGTVSMSFRSGSSSFTLQQQPSNWDSRTLLDNVVAMNEAPHKTYQSQGRTVFVYGNNAAWVNGGVLYSMNISGEMSHQEIVAIATSM